MSTSSTLFIAVGIGMISLLFMIIKLKWPAFISLLLTSIITALVAGMAPDAIIDLIKNGMGSTLGFIATVVGLGAIFGGILEHTGAAKVLANGVLDILGESRAPFAMLIIGFLVAIPVFFDVGIIIMYPMIVALQQKSGKSILYYAVPLLSGLAVTHAFVPPTPGPLAVAEILGINLGYMIMVGILVGFPAAYVAGVLYGKRLSSSLYIAAPIQQGSTEEHYARVPSFGEVLAIMVLPILLIVNSTLLDSGILPIANPDALKAIKLICHPFTALIIANIMAWYVLGRKYGIASDKLSTISSKSLQPVGLIILVTGAGGVFKQVLVDTGAGKLIAESMATMGLSVIVFAFLAATIVRVLQGSATVAMITAAGLVAPILVGTTHSQLQLAAIGISIASGSTMASHLNDSGFWLIKEFFGLTESQAVRTWTIASTILGITGFAGACLVYNFG